MVCLLLLFLYPICIFNKRFYFFTVFFSSYKNLLLLFGHFLFLCLIVCKSAGLQYVCVCTRVISARTLSLDIPLCAFVCKGGGGGGKQA